MTCYVLLTRPEGENEGLGARLSDSNFEISIRPLIKLSALPVTATLKAPAMDLDQYDRIIFVSKSAVKFALPLLDAYWPQWPVAPTWLAVGKGTADELAEYDIKALYPENAGSEGLLALPGLQHVADQKILIVRGTGGRELLGNLLNERGATVVYWEVYEREPVTYRDWRLPKGAIVVITSVEILESLADQLKGQMGELHAVVVSARIAEHSIAKQSAAGGFASVTNAGGASEQALYDAVVKLSETIGH